MMSSRRVDLRTTRKARPTSDLAASSSLNSRTRSRTRLSQRSTKKKDVKPKSAISKHDNADSKSEQMPSSSDLQLKSRRRRADASDYIRRRFLYDENDNAVEKVVKSKSVKSQKRLSHETKYQSSPLALMAASSANYQKKRKKFNVRTSPIVSRSPCGRRVRRPKIPSPVDEYSDYNMSAYDVGASDGEVSAEFVNRIPENYSQRRTRMEHDENSRLIKPIFRKVYKREPCSSGDYHSESHQGYESSLPELTFDDCMSDFTRRRGPLALSRRARHRIVPRSSTTRNDELKDMTDYPDGEFVDFGFADPEPDFRHHVRGTFPLDHGISLEDSNRMDVSAWSGQVGESDEPNSLNPLKSSIAVDIEDFAGDLLPQSSASSLYPPVSGSSRRKSPVRPMQVLRNETGFYPENGASGQAGANLIQQKISYPSFSQSSSAIEPVSTAAAGLVDLCAAAVLDSTALSSSQVSQPPTQIPVSSVHSSQPIITNAAQYSLINPGLVSIQPGSRVFVDASVRTPITGYTVASTTPSRISLMPGRINYGHSQNASRISHSVGGKTTTSSAVSSSGGPSLTNSSSRRRPTILKRKEAPPAATSPAPAPKISPVPRPSPPFMRTALRSMQTSPLMSTLQRSVRPLTYTIVSAPGQAGVFAVTPASHLQSTLPTSQTASSRLFGAKRTSTPTATTEVCPVGSVTAPPNVALFSCLPPSSPVTPAQTPVRYTLVQDSIPQKKFYIPGGDSDAGIAGDKRPLQSIETTNKEGASKRVQGNSAGFSQAQEAASINTAASNQNLPP